MNITAPDHPLQGLEALVRELREHPHHRLDWGCSVVLREYMVAMSVYAEVFQGGLPADSPMLIDIVTRRRLAKNWVRKRSEYNVPPEHVQH